MKKTLTVFMMLLLVAMLIISCDNNPGETKADTSAETPATPTTPAENSYTVTFNVEGNTTTIASKTTDADGKVDEPTDKPAKDGFIFDHWAAEENGTSKFNFADTVISDNTTLYAVFRDYYIVGDTGPAGGIIIYDCDADNNDGQNEGAGTDKLKSDVCGWRYLEAAPTDAPKGSTAVQYAWGTNGNLGTGTKIGDGWKNAVIFMDEVGYPDSFPAAKACEDYGNGTAYDDWFLPSYAELDLVFNNRAVIGGFTDGGYYSSSETGDSICAWYRLFGGMKTWQGNSQRFGTRYVRPIRAFLDADTANPPVLTNKTPQYTVTFKVGTETVATQTVKKGRNASAPSVTPTTNEKYRTFAFWSLDGSNEYKFSENTISGDITLTAVFKDYGLGDTGPAGGKIFYVNENYDATSTDNNWKYLEAASISYITKTEGWDTIRKFVFGNYPENIYNTATDTDDNTAIGKGKSNTTKLVAALGDSVSIENEHGMGEEEGETSTTTENFAAKLCADYEVTYNGTKYDDWFLPSKDELVKMAENKTSIGNFENDGYWSSSESSNTEQAGYYNFWDSAYHEDGWRSEKKYVRPIRSF